MPSSGDFTKEEWQAIYDAVVQVKVGEGKSLGEYMRIHRKGSLDEYYAASKKAYERGEILLKKIEANCE